MNVAAIDIYSSRALECFVNPRFAREPESYSLRYETSDGSCGVTAIVYINVEKGAIADMGFKAFGCPATIASFEAACHLLLNTDLEKASLLTGDMIRNELGGLPDIKYARADFAAHTVVSAINEYRKGN